MVREQFRMRALAHDGDPHRVRALFHRPPGSGRPAPAPHGAGRRPRSHLHRPRPHRRPTRPRSSHRRRLPVRHAGCAETRPPSRVILGHPRYRRPASGTWHETDPGPDALRPGRSRGQQVVYERPSTAARWAPPHPLPLRSAATLRRVTVRTCGASVIEGAAWQSRWPGEIAGDRRSCYGVEIATTQASRNDNLLNSAQLLRRIQG